MNIPLNEHQRAVVQYFAINIEHKAKAYATNQMKEEDWIKVQDLIELNEAQSSRDNYPVIARGNERKLFAVSPSYRSKFDQDYHRYLEEYIFNNKDLSDTKKSKQKRVSLFTKIKDLFRRNNRG